MKKIKDINGVRTYEIKWEERQNKYNFYQELIFPRNTYNPWFDDQEFMDIYSNHVQQNTLVDIYRCYELWNISKRLKNTKGSILEVGVWKGGTGYLLAENINSNDSIFLCDTFRGVVKTSEKDNHYKGGEHDDVDFASVKVLFQGYKKKNIQILKGIFPDQTAKHINSKELFKLCHIDVDAYKSAKDIFEWVWPRIIQNGYVIFDDYGFASCEGVTKLVNDIVNTRKDLHFIYNINGHAILIKK